MTFAAVLLWFAAGMVILLAGLFVAAVWTGRRRPSANAAPE